MLQFWDLEYFALCLNLFLFKAQVLLGHTNVDVVHNWVSACWGNRLSVLFCSQASLLSIGESTDLNSHSVHYQSILNLGRHSPDLGAVIVTWLVAGKWALLSKLMTCRHLQLYRWEHVCICKGLVMERINSVTTRSCLYWLSERVLQYH